MLKFQWRGQSKEAGMTEQDQDDMGELKQRLQEEGLDADAPDDQKLQSLWQLYVKTEGALKVSLSSVEELRQQQAEEMREVENYVEHIRSLSDEREALTLEFEAENEQLKADIVRLTNALEEYKSDDIRDMLLQQNLEEIASGTTSEQIAYLLVERARLMDELEAVEARATVDTAEGPMTCAQVLELLEQERLEFEEDLSQQRDNLRNVREAMRRTHEEEVAGMMTENEKLQQLLDETKLQTSQLEESVASLREQLASQQAAVNAQSSSQMEVETERAARDQAHFEVRQLQCQLQEAKADNASLTEKLCHTEGALSEASKATSAACARQVELETALSNKDNDIQNLQESKCKLTSDMRAMEVRIQLMQDEIDDLHHQSNGLVQSGDDLQVSMKKEVQDLTAENQKLKSELERLKTSHNEETRNLIQSALHPHEEQEDKYTAEMKDKEEAKIHSLDTKLYGVELSSSQREMTSQHTEFRKTPEDDARLKAVEQRAQEMSTKLTVVKAEKDELFNLLETQRQQNSSLRQEMAANMERLTELETSFYQLQTENKELSAKLSSTIESASEQETMLEFKKCQERRESQERLAEAYQTVDELKVEVQRLNAQLIEANLQQEAATNNLATVKAQNAAEVDGLHAKHHRELQEISQRLETAYSDITELRNRLNDREEEITHLRNESNLYQSAEAKLKVKLDTEEHERSTLKLNHADTCEQLTKARSREKELSIKVSSLETTNENLRQELDRMRASSRETEKQLSQRLTTQALEFDTASQRANTAERKLYELQRDLESALRKLQAAEEQLKEAGTLRSELLEQRHELSRLRDQLQDEKLQRTHATYGSEQLTEQVSLLREKERAAVARSNDLQKMLLQVEAELDTLRDQTHNTSQVRIQAEVGRKSLQEQMVKMQQELQELQVEMVATTKRYDAQVQKYNDRKHRTKTKLQKARELFHTERSKYHEEVEQLQQQLFAAQANLAKDNEWKQQLQETHKKLLIEKRELLAQVAEQEETVHDQTRSLSVLQVRARYLEEENHNLQARIDSLSRQKSNLDKLIKEYQLERYKEAIDTMSTDVDAVMSPRISCHLPGNVIEPANQIVPLAVSQNVEALVSPRVPSPSCMSSPQQWRRPPSSPLARPSPVYADTRSPDLLSDGVEL